MTEVKKRFLRALVLYSIWAIQPGKLFSLVTPRLGCLPIPLSARGEAFFVAARPLHAEGAFMCNQVVQIVTVRAICTEKLRIEQTLDAAAQAHLVRKVVIMLGGPAHVLVPAAAQHESRGAT